MRVAHLLRKCDPAEWGGTESAIQRLLEGLRSHNVSSVVLCPRLEGEPREDALTKAGWEVKRFTAHVPVWGISEKSRQQMVAVGGNLVSFELAGQLWREPALDILHSHTMGRLAITAMRIARWRDVPFVMTIHGGFLDLPKAVKNDLSREYSGVEWGKVIGALLGSRRFLEETDAILTCNTKEAALLREKYPQKRIVVQPHGVTIEQFRTNHREAARQAYPQLGQRDVLLAVGRIDVVKNQGWLVEQMPEVLRRHPNAMLVLAGACTNKVYGEELERRIQQSGLGNHVLLTGGLPPGDPRLIGLMQLATAIVLPSLSETFGLVLLEAWAAGATVISSRTSGATALIQDGQNGRIFDLEDPQKFHESVDEVFQQPARVREYREAGVLLTAQYDVAALAGRLKGLYADLIEERNALRHSTRRRYECADAG